MEVHQIRIKSIKFHIDLIFNKKQVKFEYVSEPNIFNFVLIRELNYQTYFTTQTKSLKYVLSLQSFYLISKQVVFKVCKKNAFCIFYKVF